MSATEFNILTITEPTIELEPFEISDSESGTSEDDGPKDLPESSTFIGDTYPAIRVNSYDFNKGDIAFFNLEINGFLPRLTVTVEDNAGMFTINSYPKDGDCLMLIIKSKDEDLYKPIRMDFDILSVDAPPVSRAEESGAAQGGGADEDGVETEPMPPEPPTFTFSCRAKIPKILAEACQSFGDDTSFNHLNTIADELKLGYASNETSTDDSMIRLQAFDTYEKFIKDTADTCYMDENSFFECYIDPYYYLNFVNVNKQFSGNEDLEDTLSSFEQDLTGHQDIDNDAANKQEARLMLTNLQKGSANTSRYVDKYSMVNNSGQIFLMNGYKRTAQYYSEDAEAFLSFDVDPLTTEDAADDDHPLKGNLNDSRFEEEVKFKYMGKHTDNMNEGNAHLNYHYAVIQNLQNNEELDKLKVIVELPTANMSLYRFQRLPFMCYEEVPKRIKRQEQLEKKAEEAGVTRSNKRGEKGDTNPERPGPKQGVPKLNEFMTGMYVIGEIKYTYSNIDPNMRQTLTLLRRDWPHPV
tara:strand:- start:4433 stop:6007 length:1575 start_codon:yes stop_codon:yes gene_type:complete